METRARAVEEEEEAVMEKDAGRTGSRNKHLNNTLL